MRCYPRQHTDVLHKLRVREVCAKNPSTFNEPPKRKRFDEEIAEPADEQVSFWRPFHARSFII